MNHYCAVRRVKRPARPADLRPGRARAIILGFDPRAVEFNKKGLKPKGGLSPRDRTWIHKFYPPLGASDLRVLEPLQSQFLDLTAGDQADFVFEPVVSRSYTIQTVGPADTHLGLFEEVDGKSKRRAQDDDSGESRNAKLRVKLQKGGRYVIRARLKHAEPDATPSILVS